MNEEFKMTRLGTPKYSSMYFIIFFFLLTSLYFFSEILSPALEYSSKCDVFSFGVIIFELLFGYNYFYHKTVILTLLIFFLYDLRNF